MKRFLFCVLMCVMLMPAFVVCDAAESDAETLAMSADAQVLGISGDRYAPIGLTVYFTAELSRSLQSGESVLWMVLDETNGTVVEQRYTTSRFDYTATTKGVYRLVCRIVFADGSISNDYSMFIEAV